MRDIAYTYYLKLSTHLFTKRINLIEANKVNIDVNNLEYLEIIER